MTRRNLIDDRSKNGAAEFEGKWIQFTLEKSPNWPSVLEHLRT